jgi:hypothetical protein
MNSEQQRHDHNANTQPDKHDNLLEKIVKHLEPPGRDVTDDDLRDPGRMTPNDKPVDNRS